MKGLKLISHFFTTFQCVNRDNFMCFVLLEDSL